MIFKSNNEESGSFFFIFENEKVSIIIISILSTIIFGLPSLIYPFGRDQGTYAYIAWRWLSGDVLYRDIYSFKPPGTPIIHVFSQLLFGNTMCSLRYFDICWTMLTATVLALVMHILFKRRFASLFSAVFYPFLYYQFSYWHSAQTDGWMLLPILLSLLLSLQVITKEHEAPCDLAVYSVFAGFFFAFAVVIKYTALAFIFPLAILFFYSFHQDSKNTLKWFVWFFAGAGVGILAVLIWLYFSGAWDSFWEIQLKIMPNYIRKTEANGAVSRFLITIMTMFKHPTLLPITILTIVGSIAGILVLYKNRNDVLAYLICWGVFASSWASCASQGKFFAYHYLPFAASGAMLGGIGFYYILHDIYAKRKYLKILPITILILIFFYPWTLYHFYLIQSFPVLTKKKPIESFWALCGWEAYSTNQNMSLVKYLNTIRDDNNTLYIWGWEPMVNFLTRMHSPSRIIGNTFMLRQRTKDLYRNEVMAAVDQDPPSFFVVSSKDSIGWMSDTKDSMALLDDMVEMKNFLITNYKFEKKIGRFTLFRLKNHE